MALLYNIVILAADVVAIALLRRSRSPLAWLGVVSTVGVVAAILGVVLGIAVEHSVFGVMRFWSYGIFLHGAVLLIVTALIWRRSHLRLAIVAVLLVFALVAIAVDAFLIEPTWLEVSHRRIASSKIHKPLRIVVLADLQTDQIGPYEKRVLHQVLDENPDVVLLAGDYIQSRWEEQERLRDELRQVLAQPEFRQLAAKSVFAVQGNCDPPDWAKPFKAADLGITIVNATRSFDLGQIELTCLSIGDSSNTTLRLANANPDRFHLVLGHSPNYARGKIDADLLVSGHTHGGQVCIPGIGPIFTLSRVPRSWGAGLTDLPGQRKLLVVRGVGMERECAPRIRFCCRPELAVIDLVPQDDPPK